jgi:hypothetical protein
LWSGLNPNGFRVLEVLGYYRQSPLQSQILEWYRPALWEVSPFTISLYGGLLVLLSNRRRVRPVDWLLLAVFGAAGILAFRNVPFVAFVGASLVAIYLPEWNNIPLFRTRMAVEFSVAGVLLVATVALIASGGAFQFRISQRTPVGAADFLQKHHIQGRLFNTYSQGGYLIWRLWPQLQVFVDGRALNEGVAQNAQRIIYAAEADKGGKSDEDLLKEYGIDVIVMECFEPVSGSAYYLPAALADPQQTDWKLVYRDAHDITYMRRPPPDIQALNSLEGLDAMEAQCSFLLQDGAPACTRGMVDVFMRIGDQARARKWAEIRRGARIE